MKNLFILLTLLLSINSLASVDELNALLKNIKGVDQKFVDLGNCQLRYELEQDVQTRPLIQRDVTALINLNEIDARTVKSERNAVVFFTKDFVDSIKVNVLSYNHLNDELIQYEYDAAGFKIQVINDNARQKRFIQALFKRVLLNCQQ